MTIVLRNELTGKCTKLTKVQKLFEDRNYIRVYFKSDDERHDWTSYAFATVVSVEQDEIWEV